MALFFRKKKLRKCYLTTVSQEANPSERLPCCRMNLDARSTPRRSYGVVVVSQFLATNLFFLQKITSKVRVRGFELTSSCASRARLAIKTETGFVNIYVYTSICIFLKLICFLICRKVLIIFFTFSDGSFIIYILTLLLIT